MAAPSDSITGLEGMPWRGAMAGLCATLIGIGLARFAYAPLIPALVDGGWLSPPAAAYLGAANLAGYLAGAVTANRLAEWVPAPRVLRWAMAAAALSFAACAFNWGIAWFTVWRFAAGVAGALLMVLAAPTLLSHVPGRYRGRVVGIVFTGIGAGVVLSGTLVPLLAESGPGPAWLGLAALAAALTAVGWRGWPAAEPAAAGRGRRAPGTGLSITAVTLPVALLLLAYAGDAIGFVPHTVFFVDFVARGLERGLAVGGAYWVAFGVGALTGPILAGLAADRVGFGRSLTVALAVKAAAVAVPVVSADPLLLGVSAVLVGALTPAMVSLASGRVADLVGLAAHRQVWGWMTSAFAVAQATAAYAMSAAFDLSGSYLILFAAAALALAGAAAAAALSMRSAAARQGEAKR